MSICLRRKQRCFIPRPLSAVTAFQDYPGHDGRLASTVMCLSTPHPLPSPARYSELWQEHTPSTGVRRPAVRGTASFRGSILTADKRELVFESILERDAARMLLADRNIIDVRDQVATLRHRNVSGILQETTPDFMVRTVSGRRTVIAVKPQRRRESSGIDAQLAAVQRDNPRFSDEYVVRTEDDISRASAHNSQLTIRSRLLRLPVDQTKLKAVCEKYAGNVLASDLASHFSPRCRGFTAIVNAIDDGWLKPVSPGRISMRTELQLAAPAN